jgi:hypothetical protein
MRFLYTVTFLMIAICKLSIGQNVDTIHTEWVRNDIELIHTLEKLDKNNPAAFESFFAQFDYQPAKDTLGFGWIEFAPGKGAGYISVKADFFYYQGTIVSYTLFATLPRREELKDQYRQLYAKLLPLDSIGRFYYNYKPESLLQPLQEYNETKYLKHIPYALLIYMSPTTSTMYGYAGGISNQLLPNRKMFNTLKDSLTTEQVTTLMYAINPASRLTAIEYYMRNKNRFTNQNEIEKWIQKVYHDRPSVQTISGCIVSYENPAPLVDFYSKLQFK